MFQLINLICRSTCFFITGLCFFSMFLHSAQLPHQGRVMVVNKPFVGEGSFWFAMVNEQNELVWNHEGGTGIPVNSIQIQVLDGFYSVMLGDKTVSGMSELPDEILLNYPKLRLRIWFNDGINGVHQLGEDQPLPIAASAVVTEHMRNGVALDEIHERLSSLEMDEAESQKNEAELAITRITELESQLTLALARIEAMEARQVAEGLESGVLAKLGFKNLPNAMLDSIDLSGMENKRVNFQNAQLNGSIFTGSDYSDGNFSGADFKQANLIGGKFSGADFTENRIIVSTSTPKSSIFF